MAAHHPLYGGGALLGELGRSDDHLAVFRCGQLGVRSERDVHRAGVEQGQEPLGAQGWGSRLESIDASAHVVSDTVLWWNSLHTSLFVAICADLLRRRARIGADVIDLILVIDPLYSSPSKVVEG